LKVVFDKLSEGADMENYQELHNMPFGTYGQLTDKYGVRWIFKGNKQK
jgi:PhnB protein